MAQDQQQITCSIGAWTQLTNADVTALTFQAQEGDVHIRFTVGAVTPTETHGLVYGVSHGLRQGETVKNISALVALSGANRAWAKPLSVSENAIVYIDHA